MDALAKGDREPAEAALKTIFTFYEGDEKKRNAEVRKAGKEAYVDGELTDTQARWVLEGIGITGDAADRTISEWQYSRQTGGNNVSEAGSDYLEARIDRKTAMEALRRSGVDEEEAESRMHRLNYEKETGIAYDDAQSAYVSGKIDRK